MKKSTKQYIVTLLSVFVLSTTSSRAQYTLTDEDFNLLRQNLYENVTYGKDFDPSASDVATLISSYATTAQTAWTSMIKNPSTHLWNDYNQLQGNASNTPKHVYYSYNRILAMARAYAYPSSLHKNIELFQDIILALNFMNSYAYNATTSRIGNFWEWHMGTPDSYARIISILYNELPESVITNYKNAVVGQCREFTQIGNYTYGNQAFLCRNLFYCGVLTNSQLDIEIAMDNFVRAVVDNTTLAQRKRALSEFVTLVSVQGDYHNYKGLTYREGIYDDGTFIQHLTLPYIGGYGADIIETTASWSQIMRGTDLSFSQEIKDNLEHWIKKAYFIPIYEGEMMMAYMGRGITKNPHDIARGIINNIILSADLLDNDLAISEIKSVCKRMLLNNNYYTRPYQGLNPMIEKQKIINFINDNSIPIAENTPFNHNMAACDRIIHNRPNFRFAISMSSTRVGKYESINRENTKGWYTGDGMTYTYLPSDRSQYVNNLSLCNPHRLAGTTVDVIFRSPVPSTGNYGLFGTPRAPKDWVGGTTLRGLYGTAGMDLAGEVSSLSAKKAWFMFDDEIVCLGAGINMTETRASETIIENRKSLKRIHIDGILKPSNKGYSETLLNPSWAHLEGTGGYFFPTELPLSIYRDYDGFTQLFIRHNTSPSNDSYAYVLMPSSTKDGIQEYSKNPDIKIIANTASVQAVTDKRLNATGYNFWQAGTIGNLTVNKPACVMTQSIDHKLYISLSDPTWKTESIQLSLLGHYSLSEGASPLVTLTHNNSHTIITFNTLDQMGKSINITLLDEKPSHTTAPLQICPTLVTTPEGVIILSNIQAPGGTIKAYSLIGQLLFHDSITSDKWSKNLDALGNKPIMLEYVSSSGVRYTWKIIK